MKALPGIYPPTGPRPGASPAEQEVHARLKERLPEGYYAWHSLRLRTKAKLDTEADFVIADPRRGYVVLEVKGGAISQEDGLWFQNGRPLHRSPMEQARGFAHALHLRLRSAGSGAPFGAAVCFPDVAFDQPPSQADLRGVCLGRQDLPYLDRILPTIFDHALPEGHQVGNDKWIDEIHSLWGGSWLPHARLGTLARADAAVWLKLDEVQQYVLEELFRKQRVLVTGAAGSGKTMLAAELARREAKAGRRVLYLCFTEGLALTIRAQLEAHGVRCSDFGRFAREVVRAGTGEEALPEQESWDSIACRAAEIVERGAGITEWPEVVIVDEAQDLTAALWLFVDQLAKSPCRLFVFQDLAQRFWAERGLNEGDAGGMGLETMTLPASYRCPPGIRDLAELYAGRDYDRAAIESALATGTIKLLPCPSDSSVSKRVGQEISRLRAENLAPKDIFVVSLRGMTAEDAIFRHSSLDGHPLLRVTDGQMGEAIVADTFLRLKGLERPVVIVTDLRLLRDKSDQDGFVSTQRAVRMHIALTRAMLAVRIVAPMRDLQEDPVLAALL